MGKLLKILAVLVLLAVAALLFAVLLVDPNDFRDEIRAGFAAASGRELTIDGDVRVSLFPKPALELDGVTLIGSAGVGGPDPAKLDLVRLYPRLLPLFQGRVELDLIRVEGMRLHLTWDAQGRSNWDSGGDPKPAPQTAPGKTAAPAAQVSGEPAQVQDGLAVPATEFAMPVQPPPRKPAESPDLPAVPGTVFRMAPDGLVVGTVEVVGATVHWDDRQTGQRLELDGVAITIGPIVAGEPVAFLLTGDVYGAGAALSPRVRAEGDFAAGSGLEGLRLEPLSLRLDGVGLGPGLLADLMLQTRLEADLAARRYLLDGLELAVELSGNALSNGSLDAMASGRVELDLGAGTLSVEGLSVQSGTLVAHGVANGQGLLSAPLVTGNLVVDAFDLRTWLEQRGLPGPRTADGETFRRIALVTDWRLDGERLGLEGLVLGVDQTEVTGTAERVSTTPPGYRFDLLIDGVEMDRYLPPAGGRQPAAADAPQSPPPAPKPGAVPEAQPQTAESAQVAAAGGPPAEVQASAPAAAPETGDETAAAQSSAPEPQPTAAPEKRPIVATFLDQLSVDGRLRVGDLRLAKLRFGTVQLGVNGRDGVFGIDDQARNFYQGALTGKIGLDLRGPEPKVSLVQRAAGFEAGPLLADLTGASSLAGRGEIGLDLAATGRAPEALRGSLTGTLDVHVTNGVVKGFSLERMMGEARARLTGEPTPAGLPNHTDFTDLRASAEVLAGVLRNRDLVGTADNLRVTGKGTLDLVRERFDYRFAPMLVKSAQGGGIEELEGVPVPVHLTGSFSRPRWDVDVASALGAVAERELRGEGGGLFKKLEERSGIKGLEQGLRSLFGR